MAMELLLKYAPISSLVTAFVALAGAWFAWNQVKLNRQNEAKRQFSNFLDECIKHPKLAEARVKDFDQDDHLRYRWFIFKLLMCSESILEVFPDDKPWIDAVMENVSPHINFISKHVEMRCYSEHMQGEVRRLLAGNPDNRPILPDLDQ